jgi:hypothetical protein
MIEEILKIVREQGRTVSEIRDRLSNVEDLSRYSRNSVGNPKGGYWVKVPDDKIMRKEVLRDPTEFLNKEFMEKFTRYKSFEEMVNSAKVSMGIDMDGLVTINDPRIDKFIYDNTQFPDWVTMITEAANQYNKS